MENADSPAPARSPEPRRGQSHLRRVHRVGGITPKTYDPAPQSKPVTHIPCRVARLAPLVASGLGVSVLAAGPARIRLYSDRRCLCARTAKKTQTRGSDPGHGAVTGSRAAGRSVRSSYRQNQASRTARRCDPSAQTRSRRIGSLRPLESRRSPTPRLRGRDFAAELAFGRLCDSAVRSAWSAEGIAGTVAAACSESARLRNFPVGRSVAGGAASRRRAGAWRRLPCDRCSLSSGPGELANRAARPESVGDHSSTAVDVKTRAVVIYSQATAQPGRFDVGAVGRPPPDRRWHGADRSLDPERLLMRPGAHIRRSPQRASRGHGCRAGGRAV